MNEEYLKELYGYVGGEEAVGGSFDEWKSHMVANPQAQKDMFGYLGGEEAVGGTYDEWLNHTGIGKQTEIPIEGISDVVKKKEIGEEVSEPLEQPTTSDEKFEQWEIDLFKHFDDNPESLETASNIDIRKYNEYKNTPTEFTEDEIKELEAIDRNPRNLAWGSQKLRDKYVKYKKQQNKSIDATKPLKEAASETEEQKSLFDMASSNVNEWYSSMGGMTPIRKMEVFKTKIDPLYKAYEQDVLYAETQEDLDKINSDFKEQTSQIAQELALDVTEDGSVKPFEDEVEKYKDRLETELRIGSKRLSEQERDSYLNDVADRLAAGTSSFSANMVDLVGFLTGANYFEGYRNLSEGQRFRAEQFREQSQRYDGTIQELAEQGNVGQAAGLAVMSAVESLPAMIPVFANPTYGIYVMGAGAGVEEYRSIEDKDIPEWKKVAMSVSAGMNEAIWEKAVTVPILAKSKQAMLSMGKRQGKDIVKKAVDASLKNSAYKANGQMPEWVAEGLSEVATGVSNDIAAKIYVDPDTQIGSHAFDDFTVGAVMGKIFSIPSNAVSKLEKMEQKKIVQSALESIPDDVDFETTLDLLEVISERDALVQMEDRLADEFKGKYRPKIIELTDKANEISAKYYAEKTGKEVGTVEAVGDSQQKIDYLIDKGVKIPDGTTGEELDALYDKTKSEEDKQAIDEATGEVGQEERPTVQEEAFSVETLEPQKPIAQMNGEELRSFADEIKQYESNLYDVIFGDMAKEVKQLEISSEGIDVNKARKAAEKLDQIVSSLPKAKQDLLYSEQKYNRTDVIDIARNVESVESSENVGELASAIKKPMLNLVRNNTDEGSLAVLNAARQRAEQLNIPVESLLNTFSRIISRDVRDVDDAMLVVKGALQSIATTSYTKQQKAVEPRVTNLKEETKDDEKKVQVEQVQEQDEERQTEKPTEEVEVSEEGAAQSQEDVVQEVVDRGQNGKLVEGLVVERQEVPTVAEVSAMNVASKVVDTKGKPLVVYQGRSRKGIKSLFKDGEGWFSVNRGVGVQFADMEKHARLSDTPEVYDTITNEELKGEVHEVTLDVKNPMYVDLSETMWDRRKERVRIAEAKEKGHDGLVITENGKMRDIVVFNESQINPTEQHQTPIEAKTEQKGVIAPSEEKVAEKAPKQPSEQKIKEASKQIADTLRKAKFTQSINDLSQLKSDPTAPLQVAWDGAIELAAKTIEAGGTVAQAVADGVSYLKESDWYKSLSDNSKKIAEQRVSEDITKTLEDAEKNGKQAQEAVQEEGVSEEEVQRVRVRDTEKDGVETEDEKVEEVLKETQRVLKSRKGSKVVSHFAARMTLDETSLSKELKERIVTNRMGMHDILTDEEADAIAENIIKNNSLSDIQKLSMNERIHPSIRVGLFVGAHKILAKEEMAATKEGRTDDAEMWGNEAYDYYQRFNNDAARKAGQLLRRLGTDLVMNEFAPYAWVGMYKDSVDRERIELTNTSSHKNSRQKFTKAAKESRQRAIDKTVAELDSIVKTKDIKEKVEKLKKKESELIAQWKKARKESASVAVIPYLTQADIEFGSQILLVKLERFGYNQTLAIKSLIKTFKGVGVDLKEEDAKKLLPDQIDGMTIDEKERQNEIEKHAMRVASGIVSEVVERKQKDDPVQRMINTLLGKFKERDTKKKKKEPKSDLERIAEAIRNVDEYADVWAEANAVAIDEINKNEKLSPQQKQEAIDRVNRAYKEATSFSFTEAQVDRAIKRKMKDLDMRIKDVVKEFLPLQSVNRERVLQSMLEDTGLDGKQAEKLSQAVLNRFDKILASEKTSLIDKYIGKTKESKTNLSEHKNKQKKTAISELLELVNIGAFDSAEFREAYATAVGIRNFDAEVAEKIKQTAKAIQSEKEDIRKHKMSQDLLKTIAFYGGLKFSDAANAVWYTNVLGNIKTQERNIFGGISGVTSRLMAEAIGTGRVLPILRGVFTRGFRYGWQRFRDVWKEGYAPFSDRLEIPNTAEVFRMELKGTDKGIVQWMWNSMKYVGRFMNGADLLNATIGKEGFAELLAHEALGVNRAKYAFNPKYRQQINQKVDEYLHVGKAEVDRYRTEIEEDSKEFGYSDEDKMLILLDKIDKARPIELTEESTRFGIYSTGNVSSYGTLGLISEMLKWSLKGIGMPVWKNRKTGEVTYIAPLSLFAAFTKIAGNIGSMSLNFVPLAGIPRIITGKYGGHFSYFAKKGIFPQGTKYVVDLTEREKRSIINMQVMGTVATAALFALSDGGDDDDPLIQITANLTGDYKKNVGIQDAEEYSLGIKLPNDKRLWISYKYTPLITMLAPIGYYRDAYKYRKEDRTSMDVLQESYLKIPFFLSDMTAIASMTDVIEKSISNTGQLDQLAKSLQRTISSFYTPSIYRDVTNMVEFLYGGTAPLSKKSGVVLDPNNLHERFMGRSPIAVAERIVNGEPSMYSVDVLGRTMPTKQVWNELVSVSDGSDVYNATYDNHISKMGGLTAPDPSRVFFNVKSEDGGFTKIRLYLHDKDQAEVWYNYCKKRADMIFRAMQVYSNLDEEQYKKEMEAEISRASDDAKLQAEAELMQQPIDKIKKWQIKR